MLADRNRQYGYGASVMLPAPRGQLRRLTTGGCLRSESAVTALLAAMPSATNMERAERSSCEPPGDVRPAA